MHENASVRAIVQTAGMREAKPPARYLQHRHHCARPRAQRETPKERFPQATIPIRDVPRPPLLCAAAASGSPPGCVRTHSCTVWFSRAVLARLSLYIGKTPRMEKEFIGSRKK